MLWLNNQKIGDKSCFKVYGEQSVKIFLGWISKSKFPNFSGFRKTENEKVSSPLEVTAFWPTQTFSFVLPSRTNFQTVYGSLHRTSTVIVSEGQLDLFVPRSLQQNSYRLFYPGGGRGGIYRFLQGIGSMWKYMFSCPALGMSKTQEENPSM